MDKFTFITLVCTVFLASFELSYDINNVSCSTVLTEIAAGMKSRKVAKFISLKSGTERPENYISQNIKSLIFSRELNAANNKNLLLEIKEPSKSYLDFMISISNEVLSETPNSFLLWHFLPYFKTYC